MGKKSVLAVLISAVLGLCLLSACSKEEQSESAGAETQAQATTVANEATESAEETEAASDSSAEAETSAENSAEETTLEEAASEEAAAPETVEEIVALYNASANRIKKEATKVTKNFEKRRVNNLKVPELLQSTADSIVPKFISDDNEPITYTGAAQIKENFIVPEQSYVSRLTAADVVTASCKDKGDEYEIYIKLKDEKNPASGKGVGSACDVIEAAEVAEKAPSFVKELSTYYYSCEITARIDKATGKMTHTVSSTPVSLNVVVDLFGTHDVVADLTFVKDYSIYY